MNFFKTSPPVTMEEIEIIENELGLKFPIEFKDHYIKYNGGVPEKRYFQWPTGETTRINSFLSFKNSDDLVENYYRDFIIGESFLSEGLVMFAHDDGGNFFCVSARENDMGSVYYGNNDHYNEEDKDECLTLLDTSFKHFIENLTYESLG